MVQCNGLFRLLARCAVDSYQSLMCLPPRYHPDKRKDNDKEDATAKFQALCAVYDVLSDEKKRKVLLVQPDCLLTQGSGMTVLAS